MLDDWAEWPPLRSHKLALQARLPDTELLRPEMCIPNKHCYHFDKEHPRKEEA